nr:MAG TPA: Ribosome associated membrane protein RAMP4 [Caudoviricetes sp.]
MEADKIDSVGLIILLLFVICGIVFFIVKAMEPSPLLSRDEICQKYFGKDYVHVNNGRSADFCVDNSGIPKYPKTWNERKPNV